VAQAATESGVATQPLIDTAAYQRRLHAIAEHIEERYRP
jgi:hypothetical protein